MKLKNIINENTDRLSSKNKRQVLEAIANFNAFGESIYSKSNLKEVVQSISELCENATKLALQEHDDWFDSVTVKRDMKEVAGILKEFVKTSTESQSTQQRLESLYEDLGHKLGRYYDINEADKGDMDGDGVDEPDDEEYMDNKDKAIKKAIKNESSTEGDFRTKEKLEELVANKVKAIQKAGYKYFVLGQPVQSGTGKRIPKGTKIDVKNLVADFAHSAYDVFKGKKPRISGELVESSSIKLKGIVSEHHALGVLPSSKLLKMKWNPLKEEEPTSEVKIIDEGASSEEKRIAMLAVKKQAKYRSVDIATAIQDQIRALQELASDVKKGKLK